MSSAMSRQKWFLIVAIAILAGGGGLTSYIVRNPRETKPIELVDEGRLVRTVRLDKEEKTFWISGFGTVRPRNEIKVVAEVSGRVVRRSSGFRDGGFVKKGDFLFEIDPVDYKLFVVQRRAEIAQLEADIERLHQEEKNFRADLAIAERHFQVVQKELERNQRLRKQGVVSPGKLDISHQAVLRQERTVQAGRSSLALIGPQVAQKKASLEVTRSRLEEAFLDLKRTRISAPFDARVRDTKLEVGDYVREGNTVGSIYDSSVLEVPVSVPVEDARWVFRRVRDVASFPRSQQEVERFFPSAKVLWSRFGQTFEWDGRVTLVGAGLDEATRAMTMVVEVPEPYKNWVQGQHPPLTVGMFVRVTIKGITVPDVYVIPRSALRPRDQVFLFKDGKLDVRDVQILRKGENEVIIQNGLKKGERLILSAIPAAVPGMKLRTIDADQKQVFRQETPSP